MESIIKLKDISKSFKKKEVLKKIDFELYSKEICAFVAMNGQGKTTTLKIISGIINSDSGSVIYKQKKIKDNFIFMPELPYFFDHFNIKECIDYMLSIEKLKIDINKLNLLLKKYSLQLSNKPIKHFSKGMRQKLAILMCELSQKKLVLLDEPYSGLDIVAQKTLKDAIIDMKKNGKTVFFTSHNLEFVYDISDRFIILHNGLIKETRNTSEFNSFEELKSLFEQEVYHE